MKKPLWFLVAAVICVLGPVPLLGGAKKSTEEIVSKALKVFTVQVNEKGLTEAVSAGLEGGLPPDQVEVLAIAAGQANRPPDELGRYLDAVKEVYRGGFPISPVVGTILEGLAKGLLEKNIEGKVAAMRADLPFAADIARRHAAGRRERELELLVKGCLEALRNGFSRQHVERASAVVRSEQKNPTFFIAGLEAMMALRNLGLSPEQSTELVALSVSKGFSARDLGLLPQLLSLRLFDGPAEPPSPDAAYAALFQDVEDKGRGSLSPLANGASSDASSERAGTGGAASGGGGRPGGGGSGGGGAGGAQGGAGGSGGGRK